MKQKRALIKEITAAGVAQQVMYNKQNIAGRLMTSQSEKH